jgi:hypothetical protein
MTRERIDNLTEAERLTDDYHRVRPHRVKTNDHVGATPVHAVAGTGMNGMEAQLDKLADTERQLAGLHFELEAQLRAATRLTDELNDGSGPIAVKMRKSFVRAADGDGGVQKALREYMLELIGVRQAILATLLSYERVDSEALDMLKHQIEDLNAEVR